MKRLPTILTLQMAAAASLAGCASPALNTADSAGPTFLQMPVNTQALMGATPQLLKSEFGQPSLLRMDGTAQVWLYHIPDCGLNLILYPDNAGTPRVAMAAPTNDGGDTAACSTALQRAHADSGAAQSAAIQPQIVPAAIELAAPPPPLQNPTPSGTPAAHDGAGTDGLERTSSS